MEKSTGEIYLCKVINDKSVALLPPKRKSLYGIYDFICPP